MWISAQEDEKEVLRGRAKMRSEEYEYNERRLGGRKEEEEKEQEWKMKWLKMGKVWRS